MNSSADTYLSIVGTYRVDTADAAAFASIAADSVPATVNKPGCLYYIASRDVNEPGVFHLAEGWADKAALDAHTSSPDFHAMLEKAMKLRILSREIYISHSQGRTLAP
ncbi:putative quinol monooxygenase [Stappia sp.]|uniref:putative quinol monooxygenase n=1 Tax=Stappia sp. TaxID=1870903 RepID=UPI003A9A1F33